MIVFAVNDPKLLPHILWVKNSKGNTGRMMQWVEPGTKVVTVDNPAFLSEPS